MSTGDLRPFKPHRWFAAFYARSTGREPAWLQTLRRVIVGPAAGRVLELGAGVGGGFTYYREATEVVATEPDPFMLRRAREAAGAAERPIALVQCVAEALPLPDASVDTVLSVLVLCTVQDPDRALAEARRVLRPGGTLRFVEHVRGGGLLGQTHDVIAPAWRYFVGGCNPNRRTEAAIASAGFEITRIRHRRVSVALPLIVGVARPTER